MDAAIEKLSRREREVLSLVTDGMTNAEIARELHISVATVKTHLDSIFAKLGVSNRIQAAVLSLGYRKAGGTIGDR